MMGSLPATGTINTAAYGAALQDVVCYDASASGRLRLLDRDRADLLHRLSTNDIKQLHPGEGIRTVLTNHHARIIDLLTVYALPEHLLLVTSPAQSSAVHNLFRRNIFFQDRVKVEDVSASIVQFELYGPNAARYLGEQLAVDPADWPMHHIEAVTFGNARGWLARALPLGGQGWRLFVNAEDRDAAEAALADIVRLDDSTYDLLRVEQGYPVYGRELSLEYIPLETRLVDAVSFSKGCYVGQEIIARMESRNRLAKQLMGLRLSAAVDGGGKLRHEGKEVGDLTSVVVSPRFGPIGLAYVRTAVAEPGTVVDIDADVTAEVAELPFT
jgi:tRNA-modifying protein YgfZ